MTILDSTPTGEGGQALNNNFSYIADYFDGLYPILIRHQSVPSAPGSNNGYIYVQSGELYYKDGSNNVIQLTSGGSILVTNYWSRVGTELSPVIAGDDVLTTGDGTFGTIKIPQIGGVAGKYNILQGGANTIDLTYTLPIAYPASTAFFKSSNAGVLSFDTNIYYKSGDAITTSNLTDSGLTITRVPYASTGGLLVDSTNFIFDGTTLIITALAATSATGITLGTDVAGGSPNIAGYIKMFSAGDNAFYSTFTAGTQSANANYTFPLARPTANSQALLGTNADPSVLSWGTDFGANSLTTTGIITIDSDSSYLILGDGQDGKLIHNGSGVILQSDVITATDYLQLRGGTNGIDFNIGATQQLILTDGKLAPTTTNDIDLGDSTHLWKDTWTIGKQYFRDSALYISSDNDGHLDLTADTSIDLNAAVAAGSNSFTTTGTGTFGKIGANTASPSAVIHGTSNGVLYRSLGVVQLQVGTAPAFIQENGALGAADASAITTYNGYLQFWKRNATGNFVGANLKMSLDSSGNLLMDGGGTITTTGIGTFGAIKNTATQTTLTPTGGAGSGTAILSQPEQGSSYKKVIVYFNAYTYGTNAQAYTYPTAFSNTPIVSASGVTVTATITTTTYTITAAVAQTGFVILDGW